MEQHQSPGAQQSTALDKDQEVNSQRQSSAGNAGDLPLEDRNAAGTGDESSEEGRS